MRAGLLPCMWIYMHTLYEAVCVCVCHVVEMTGWWLQPFSVCAGSG